MARVKYSPSWLMRSDSSQGCMPSNNWRDPSHPAGIIMRSASKPFFGGGLIRHVAPCALLLGQRLVKSPANLRHLLAMRCCGFCSRSSSCASTCLHRASHQRLAIGWHRLWRGLGHDFWPQQAPLVGLSSRMMWNSVCSALKTLHHSPSVILTVVIDDDDFLNAIDALLNATRQRSRQ